MLPRMALALSTVHGAWPIALPDIKLQLRGRLPGASAFDDAAFGLRQARGAGTSADVLLASAMAGSWLVNSAVPSPVIQKWLGAKLRKEWASLIESLESPSPDRPKIEAHLTSIVAAGGSLGAISKVLSLVCLTPVPLMPDAALAHVLRAVPVPTEADAQTAPVRCFFPMFDRMHETAMREAEALTALVKVAPLLRPADVLDRVVWFDSVGYRHFRNDQGGWHWVRNEAVEAVVFVRGETPAGLRPGACVEVPGEDDFSARALDALHESGISRLDE